MDNLIDKKNQEISKKSTELIVVLKDKVLGDLFVLKNKNLEEIFLDSIKQFKQEKPKSDSSTLLIKNNSFRKGSGSFNSSSNYKKHRVIIDEIANFVTNRENSSMYFKQLNQDKKTSDKVEKHNNNINTTNNNLIETTVDEKTENKDFSSGLTATSSAEVKGLRFFEKELQNLQIEKEKEKIVDIFRELKNKYLRKENSILLPNEKVYAQTL